VPNQNRDAQGHIKGQAPDRWRTLVVLAVSQLMLVLDSSIMNIAIPSAKTDLGISDQDAQWIITAYTLAFGSLLLLGGRIGDYMGRKKIFLVGLIGFAVASAIGGIAINQEMLFASRALQGVFGALLAPATLAIISQTFTDPKERAKAFGVIGAISGGGAAITWHDHRFFDITHNGVVFHGEIVQDQSENRELTIKINHRVFQVKDVIIQ